MHVPSRVLGVPHAEGSQCGTAVPAQRCPGGHRQTGGAGEGPQTHCRGAGVWDEQSAVSSPAPALHLNEGSQVGIIRRRGCWACRGSDDICSWAGGCSWSGGAGPAPLHHSSTARGGVSSPRQPFTLPGCLQAAPSFSPRSPACSKTLLPGMLSSAPSPSPACCQFNNEIFSYMTSAEQPQTGPSHERELPGSQRKSHGPSQVAAAVMAHTALGPPCDPPLGPGDRDPPPGEGCSSVTRV